jgi:predicted RNase H-like HicB family nuclease
MGIGNCKTILYRQESGGWVKKISSIPGCYALMDTREAAFAELTEIFEMIAEEYREKGKSLPEIVNA